MLGLLVASAVVSVFTVRGSDREMRTRGRQFYDVIVGDYYTGRSPYARNSSRTKALVNRVADAGSKAINASVPATTWTTVPATKPVTSNGNTPCSITAGGLVNLSIQTPREVAVGEAFTYEIKAVANGCAGNVVVTDVLPEGTSLVETQPAAIVSGNQLTWNLGNLDSGETKTLKITVKSDREGALLSCATLKADPRVCAQTLVGRPALAIDKSGPETAQLGADLNYTITVRNTGSAVAKNVVVTDKVPAGLGGVKEIPYNVGNLGPGQSNTITVTLKAAERGKHCNVAVATSSNAGTVQDDACTTIVKPGLKLIKTGDSEMYLNKRASYKITASNIGDTELSNVVVTDTAPSPTRIESVGQGGTQNGNAASWNLGTLRPGESKDLDVILISTQPGKWCNVASVTTQQGLRDSTEFCTLWKGIPAVLLEVVDDPDPVAVGNDTTYTIRITNQGTADLINVNTVAQFPSQFNPISSQGGTVDGKSVRFPSLPRVSPKQVVLYTITAKAIGTGDSRMKVILTEDQLSSPVVEEESTRGY